MATSPWYREGTAKFTQGSTTVTGTGTRWVDFVRAGDGIQGPDGKLYQVTNVASNTSMSITPAYGNETTYWTIPIQGYVKRLADAASQLVRDFEGGAVDAIDAADRAKQSATEASASEATALSQANRAESEADRAEFEADRAQQAADDAVAVVTDGGGSIDPEAGKWPVAGADGTIKQAWVDNLEFELDALRVARNKLMYGDGPYPVLDLQFQGAKVIDPRITFTRATPDWDEYGNRYEVNEPVLTDKGLWVSGARTNLYRNSLTDQSITVTAQQYTISFYGSGSIDLTGSHIHTVVSSGERTTYTFTPTAGQLNIIPSDVEKVQLEEGPTATPYIPTEDSQVTVAASSATFPAQPLGQGSVFVDFTLDATGLDQTALCFMNDESFINQIRVYKNSAGFVRVRLRVGDVDFAHTSNKIDGPLSVGISWGHGGHSIVINGSEVRVSPTPIAFPDLSANIGFFNSDTGHLIGTINKILKFNIPLSADQLQELTTR